MLLLQGIDKTYKVVSETYDWLCEFVHPNALGSALMFSRVDKQGKKVHFFNQPIFEVCLSPTFEGGIYLPVFLDDWKKSSEIRARITSEWKPSVDVCDLFENPSEKSKT